MAIFETRAEVGYILCGEDPVDLSEEFPLPEPEPDLHAARIDKIKKRLKANKKDAGAEVEEEELARVRVRPLPDGVTDQPKPPRYDYSKRKVSISTRNRFHGVAKLCASVVPGILELEAPTGDDVLEMLKSSVINVESAYREATGENALHLTLFVHRATEKNGELYSGRFSLAASAVPIEGSSPFDEQSARWHVTAAGS